MKKHIFKIENKKGVSILLALLIMLMCAFAGATAITMAATNIGRYAHESDDTQAYFSVTSAATLIRDTFDDLVYTSKVYDYNVEHTVEYDAKNNQHSEYYTYSLTDGLTPASIKSTTTNSKGENEEHALTGTTLANKIVNALDTVVLFKSIPDEWYNRVKISPDTTKNNIQKPEAVSSSTYTFDMVSNDMSIGTIEATLIINDNYDLMFSFLYRSTNSIKLYSVTLYMEATTELVTQTVITPNPTDNKKYSEINTTKRSVKVTWQAKNATISRGEAITDNSQAEGGN